MNKLKSEPKYTVATVVVNAAFNAPLLLRWSYLKMSCRYFQPSFIFIKSFRTYVQNLVDGGLIDIESETIIYET